MDGPVFRFASVFPFLLLFPVLSPFALPPDEYLDESPDFENLLSDLPPGFDFSSASIEELREIPFLGAHDIDSIVSLRDSLSGTVTPGIRERISPLVRYLLDTPEIPGVPKAVMGEMRGGVALRGGQSPGEGRHYLKITAGSIDRVRISLLGERDPLEPHAMDFSSFGVSFPVERLKTRVVLGDFRPGFGMGLLFARYAEYLTGDHPRYYRSTSPLNSTFEESRHMRGGMVITRAGNFESCIWTSARRLDATVEAGKALSIDDTGIHYGGDPRGNLDERIGGAHFSLAGNRSELSLTGAVSRYSPGLSRPEGERGFGRPEGASFSHVSLSGRTRRGPAELSFEHAVMDGGAHATLGGIVLEGGKAETSLLLREYSPGYWALRSGAPSAFGNVSNERGVSSTLNLDLPARIALTASLDLAKMAGRSWTHPMPLSRKQFYVSLRKRIQPRLESSLTYRNSDDTDWSERRWNLRGRLENSPGKTRGWGWRGTMAWSEGERDGGPFAEAAFFGKRPGGSLTVSAGGFRIPSYSSRYYQYQPDVPGRGASMGVYGDGWSLSMVCSAGPVSGRIRMADSDLMPFQREITLQTDLSF